MRNLVLKNQAVVGTVNADAQAFQNAIRDLGRFKARWPDALKSLDHWTLRSELLSRIAPRKSNRDQKCDQPGVAL